MTAANFGLICPLSNLQKVGAFDQVFRKTLRSFAVSQQGRMLPASPPAGRHRQITSSASGVVIDRRTEPSYRVIP